MASAIGTFPSLRSAERDEVIQLLRAWADRRRGGVVFLVGPPGSGRTRLLSDIRSSLEEAGGRRRVIAGSVCTGTFRATGLGVEERRRLIDTSEDIGKLVRLALGALNLPVNVGELVGLLVERSSAALRLCQSLVAASDPTVSGGRLVPELITRAAASHDLTLLLDDLDGDGAGWCSQLVHQLAPATAEGLRLTVVATVNGPVHPPRPSDDLPDFLAAAAELLAASSPDTHEPDVVWRALEALDANDLATALACEQSVADHLWDAAGGRLSVIETLWSAWRDQRLLSSSESGLLAFAPEADRRVQPAVHDVVLERVRRLTAGRGMAMENLAIRSLQVGALEGERFTADAVAAVLDRDRDELIAFLDSTLVADAVGPDGLLRVSPPDHVESPDGGYRDLRPYRFAGTIVWLAFRNNGLMPAQRQRFAVRLRDALLALHGDATVVSGRLAALSALAEDRAATLNWQAKTERGDDRDVLRWRAHMVLGADQSGWSQTRRRQAARLLVDAYATSGDELPLDESRAIVTAAVRLAAAADDDRLEALARSTSSAQASYEGDFERAIRDAQIALDLLDALDDGNEAAGAAGALGRVHVARRALAGHEWDEPTRATVKALLERAVRDGDALTAGCALIDLAHLAGPHDPESVALLEGAVRVLPRSGRAALERARATSILSNFVPPLRAHNMLLEAVALTEQQRTPLELFEALRVLAANEIQIARFESAREHAARAARLGEEAGDEQRAEMGLVGVAVADAFLGYAQAAADTLAKMEKRRSLSALVVRPLLPEIVRARRAGLVGEQYADDRASIQSRSALAVKMSFRL